MSYIEIPVHKDKGCRRHIQTNGEVNDFKLSIGISRLFQPFVVDCDAQAVAWVCAHAKSVVNTFKYNIDYQGSSCYATIRN